MTRLSPGTIIVVIFAILFGLVGAYSVKAYLQPEPVEVAEAPTAVVVPLASIDLEPGRPLTMSDVMLVRLTREQISKRGLPNEFMSNPKHIIGRILREPVVKGESFGPTNFYPEGFGPSVAQRLRPGLRAVTVALQGTGAVHGFASAGSTVDVLFRAKSQSNRDLPETTVTLLENVEVLAIDNNSVPGSQTSKDPQSVTLAVTSEQARALKIAEGNGIFSLSLRSQNDPTRDEDGGATTLAQLLNIPQTVPFSSEIYRGGARQKVTFRDGSVESADPATVTINRDPSRGVVPAARTQVSNQANGR